MVIDIKMCRFENVPWGFRLVGGSDFEYPLTVVKVNEGSIAEEAGLREGDIIVRLNDTATSPLTHDEMNKLIKSCGNVFYFGVQRENAEPEQLAPQQFPILGTENPSTPDSYLEVSSLCRSPYSVAQSDDYRQEEFLSELDDRPCSVLSENTEIKMVEEEIAAVLSGESEVLKEHNTMGLFPKPGVCMTSEVLRTLNAEAVKTKLEKDKENKKWTTFLQKPNRPIPKSKAQLEAERRAANAYKVKIIKSAPPPKPSEPEPSPVAQITPEAEVKVEIEKEPTPPEPEIEEPPPADSELPNLEEVPLNESQDNEESNEGEKDNTENVKASEENVEKTDVSVEGLTLNEDNEIVEAHEAGDNVHTQVIPERQKTEEELALERQLADVQKQLAALSTLPSTIQATLDAVTKQLAELLPTFRLQQMEKQAIEAEEHEIITEEIEQTHKDINQSINEETENQTEVETEIVKSSDHADIEQSVNNEREQELVKKSHEPNHSADDGLTEDEKNIKQKQKRYDVIEELEDHLERKSNPKRSKRAFGPLTPSSERPLVLPGGRRWYRPKDAYNDEFIAETLSAQAELIAGTALGVNFMKYQKPEKKIDLNRSEVYKVIHHLDRQPVRGIEVRPPVVPAEVDVRKAVSSS